MPSRDQAQVVKIQGWRGDVLQQAGLLELARECGQEPVQIVQQVLDSYHQLAAADGSSELIEIFKTVADQLGELEDSAEGNQTLEDLHNVLRWDFSTKVQRLKDKVDGGEVKGPVRRWWQDQCRLAENAEWHPDSEARLVERRLAQKFKDTPDDEKVAFFLSNFKNELFEFMRSRAEAILGAESCDEKAEKEKELESLFEGEDLWYEVLLETATIVARCHAQPSGEARASLFGLDWTEAPVESIKAKRAQLLKSFHTDKTEVLALHVHSRHYEGDNRFNMEERVREDMEKFNAATGCVNEAGRAIEQERALLKDLQSRVQDLERRAKLWEGRAKHHAQQAKQDPSSLHWACKREAAKSAREIWDELRRLLDGSEVEETLQVRRIRVRLSIAEACILEGLPGNVAQLYVIGAKRLWHRTWPLDQHKQREHNALLKTILRVEAHVHEPEASSKGEHPADTEPRGGTKQSGPSDSLALALLPTACRGQRLRSDLQVVKQEDLDSVLQSTKTFDMDAYQLMVPTLEVARCDTTSPMCQTLVTLRRRTVSTAAGVGFSGAVVGVGSMLGCVATAGVGAVLLAVGGGLYYWQQCQSTARGKFLRQVHHMVNESRNVLLIGGAEAFLETLCMPLPNSDELREAAGKRLLNYPHSLEEPLEDFKGSVKFLLHWGVCPVFIGQLLLQVAEIFASRRIRTMKVDGEVQAPMYNRLKMQAEDILRYLEVSVAEGGELFKKAKEMDMEASERECAERALFSGTATFEQNQGSSLEECFAWSSFSEWYLRSELPAAVKSNAAAVGMSVKKATQHFQDGTSRLVSELKGLASLAKLFACPEVSRVELELSQSLWSTVGQVFSYFVSETPIKNEQQVQLEQLLQMTRINMAMLLLLNQDSMQEEDGNVLKAEKILQKVLKSTQASSTSSDLQVRVKAVQDFFEVFTGRRLKAIEDGACPVETFRHEFWKFADGGEGMVRIVGASAMSQAPRSPDEEMKSMAVAFLTSMSCNGTRPCRTEEIRAEAQGLLSWMIRDQSCARDALPALAARYGIGKVVVCKPPAESQTAMGDRAGQNAEMETVFEAGADATGREVCLVDDGQKWSAVQVFKAGDIGDVQLAARALAGDLKDHPSSTAVSSLKRVLEELEKALRQQGREQGDRGLALATELLRIHFSPALPNDFRKAEIMMSCLGILSEEGMHKLITDEILADTQRFLWFPSIFSKIYLTKAHSYLCQGKANLSEKCTDVVAKTPEYVSGSESEKEWLKRLQTGQSLALQHFESPAAYQAEQPAWGERSSMGRRCKSGKALYVYEEVAGRSKPAEPYGILSVNGAGVQSIMPAVILSELELRLRKPLHQIFRLMAGASTGAVIVGGLVTPTAQATTPRYSACDIAQLLVFQHKQIFSMTPTGSHLPREGVEKILGSMTYYDDNPSSPIYLRDTLGNIMVTACRKDGSLSQWVSEEAKAFEKYQYPRNLRLFDVLRPRGGSGGGFNACAVLGKSYEVIRTGAKVTGAWLLFAIVKCSGQELCSRYFCTS
ncbi:PLP2 [Symbiodinium necroappetens]|uniref:PLP2 protein n=1 Tax=Symbiodinium necroappetens TaxID=1628268 RepID=A0A812WCH2_9DINO|nr:PLP2 [Symbiodinium necroappetens]